jgi:hypothetical protein
MLLIWQQRRITFSVDELTGFSQEEAERLRDLLFRQTGRGRDGRAAALHPNSSINNDVPGRDTQTTLTPTNDRG